MPKARAGTATRSPSMLMGFHCGHLGMYRGRRQNQHYRRGESNVVGVELWRSWRQRAKGNRGTQAGHCSKSGQVARVNTYSFEPMKTPFRDLDIVDDEPSMGEGPGQSNHTDDSEAANTQQRATEGLSPGRRLGPEATLNCLSAVLPVERNTKSVGVWAWGGFG